MSDNNVIACQCHRLRKTKRECPKTEQIAHMHTVREWRRDKRDGALECVVFLLHPHCAWRELTGDKP